jgi:hypothetical protein
VAEGAVDLSLPSHPSEAEEKEEADRREASSHTLSPHLQNNERRKATWRTWVPRRSLSK